MKCRKILAVCFIGMLVLDGCLFDPREPEKPGEEASSWVIPNSPKDVFLNLRSGLAENSSSNYERSLDEGFTFIPRDEDVVQLGEEAFADWTKDIELRVISRLKGDFIGKRQVQFGDEDGVFDREDIQVGRAEFEGPYVITLDAGDGSPEQVYAGKAVFVIEQKSQGWVITIWEDVDISGNFATSSYLRGSLRAAG